MRSTTTSLLGKVCLSLLGTWAGPSWDPKNSTLLQVLVSIQSLIMVDQPFFNEPGYERMLGTAEGEKQNRAYNTVIREGTLRYAIAGMLRQPPQPFAAAVREHFRQCKPDIQEQCKRWRREDSAQVGHAATEVEKLMAKL